MSALATILLFAAAMTVCLFAHPHEATFHV